MPLGAWLLAAVAAVIVLLVFVGLMEFGLAVRGFDPTVVDSDLLWLKERERADELGNKALILVGASRIQLDLDLNVLRVSTGLEPVQLAVDGGSFIPVLRSLADDVRVTGTVLIGYQDNDVNSMPPPDRAVRLEAAWLDYEGHVKAPGFATIEANLSDSLHYHLRSYADGARPISSLTVRLFEHSATPQYLVTLADRSRLADYQRVTMPNFYYSRVIRNLGEDVPLHEGMSWKELDAEILRKIEAIKPAEKFAYDENIDRIAYMAKKIKQRGGHVIFIVMPRSAMIKEIDVRRFPRALFWDDFVKRVAVPTLNVEDYPALAAFQCPDGSHLDYRERPLFSKTLVGTLALDKKTTQGMGGSSDREY